MNAHGASRNRPLHGFGQSWTQDREAQRGDGIINRDRAYRYGMRELMAIKTEREQIKTQTELSGLNCGYGQLANFVNEVPGWGQSSVVKSLNGVTLESADNLDWQDGEDHVVALRRDDGTLSVIMSAERLADNKMLVSGSFGFTPTPYHTNLVFGIRERFSTPAYHARCAIRHKQGKLMAIAYNPEKIHLRRRRGRIIDMSRFNTGNPLGWAVRFGDNQEFDGR